MKTLIVVFLCLLLVISLWLFQINYMENSINDLLSVLANLEKDILNTDWDSAQKDMDNFSDLWDGYKKVYGLFINETLLLCIDSFLAQAEAYVACEETPNLLAILHSTKHELKAMYKRELITLRNVI